MPTVFDVRRDNMRRLLTQWGGPTSLARKLGHSNGSYLAQLVGPHPTRDVSEKTAREVEARLGIPEGWLDRSHSGPPGQPDTGLLVEAVACVHDVLHAEGVRATRAQVEELSALTYEHAIDNGRVDTGYLRRLVRLLKR